MDSLGCVPIQAAMNQGEIIICGVVVFLLGARTLLYRSIDSQRKKMDPSPEIDPKCCRELVIQALGTEALILQAPEPISNGEDERWKNASNSIREFLEQKGKISWESGGWVSPGSFSKLRDNLKRTDKGDQREHAIPIGADEAETIFLFPNDEKVYCFNALLEKTFVTEDIFSFLAGKACLEE